MKNIKLLNLTFVIILTFCNFIYSQSDSLFQPISDSLIFIDSTNVNIITTSGNIGIGTNFPTEKLEVVGNSIFSGKMRIDSTVLIKANLEVDGNTWLKQRLDVDSTTRFNDTVFFSKSAYFKNLFDSENPVIDETEALGLLYQADGALYSTECEEGPGPSIDQWVYGHGVIYANQCGKLTNIGIGTKTPTTNLDVMGTQYISGGLSIGDGNNSLWTKLQIRTNGTDQNAAHFYYEDQSVSQNMFFVPKPDAAYNGLVNTGDHGIFWSDVHQNYNSNSGFVICPYSTNSKGIKIASNGHVGICNSSISDDASLVISAPSTSSDNYFIKLVDGTNSQVLIRKDGKIFAKEVEIKTSLPDFVFDNDYSLMTLKDLERYININKHLPDVPSSIEAETNGVGVGEMNQILLKKIEELTLYIIKQQASIEELQNKINNLCQNQNEK